MKKEVNTLEAKTQLSQLLRRVEPGEEITIANRGVLVALLVPIHTKKLHRKLGMFEGKFVVLDDFETPLPDEILDAFEANKAERGREYELLARYEHHALERGGETQAELTCRIGL